MTIRRFFFPTQDSVSIFIYLLFFPTSGASYKISTSFLSSRQPHSCAFASSFFLPASASVAPACWLLRIACFRPMVLSMLKTWPPVCGSGLLLRQTVLRTRLGPWPVDSSAADHSLAARKPSPVFSGTDIFAKCYTLYSNKGDCRHLVSFPSPRKSLGQEALPSYILARNIVLNKIIPNKTCSASHSNRPFPYDAIVEKSSL